MIICSFCGKSNEQVKRMICAQDTANSVSICNKCILLCMDILLSELEDLKVVELKED